MVEKKGLQVINASYSKTGTKTMHAAFDILGYKVCDAQESVYSHFDIWEKIWNAEGDVRKHFHTLFGANSKWGYTATTDLPTYNFWDVLAEEFPDAKVILIERDEDKWANSMEKHLAVEHKEFKEMMFWRCYNWIYSKVFNHSSQAMGVYMDFMRPLALGPEARNYYGVNMDLKISQYRKHNLYVKNHCSPDRLLIYKLGDGWEPLCKFLNKPVPDEPFPHCNRMGSVIQDLINDPNYIRMMKKQLASMIIRFGIICVAVYEWYKPGAVLPYEIGFSPGQRWCTLATGIIFWLLMKI